MKALQHVKLSRRQWLAGSIGAVFAVIGMVTTVVWLWPFGGYSGTQEDPVPLGQTATLKESVSDTKWDITITAVNGTDYQYDPSWELKNDAPAETGVCWFIFGTAKQTSGDTFSSAPRLVSAVTESDPDVPQAIDICGDGSRESLSWRLEHSLRDYGYPQYSNLYGYRTPDDFWKVQRTYPFYVTAWTESYDDPPLALKFSNNGQAFYFSLNKGA